MQLAAVPKEDAKSCFCCNTASTAPARVPPTPVGAKMLSWSSEICEFINTRGGHYLGCTCCSYFRLQSALPTINYRTICVTQWHGEDQSSLLCVFTLINLTVPSGMRVMF